MPGHRFSGVAERGNLKLTEKRQFYRAMFLNVNFKTKKYKSKNYFQKYWKL
jgi:hypothetical protein